ncbi:MAG: histidine phosphatase family protein, partial [Gammaproteobacteria bacterium]|nr:histidine phosphatase family protein [Gammaproteobacteria bacterium]
MPRSLTLVRHAKSSWADAGLTDFERPLNRRGLRDAPMMGQRLARAGYQADAIISSPAVRAATTADLIAEEIGFHRSLILRKHSVYAAGLATLLEV